MLTEHKPPDIKAAKNKPLAETSVNMQAVVMLDMMLPHISKSIFTDKLTGRFGLADFPLLK